MRWLLSGWDVLDPALSRLLRINLAALLTSLVVLSGVYAVGFEPEELRIHLAVMGLSLLLVLLTLPLSPRLGPAAALVGLALSATIFAAGGTWVTPALAPLTAMLMLVPLLVAIPHLSRRWIWALMVVAVVGSAAVAALGEWRRTGHVHDVWWVNSIVVATSLPAVVLVVVYLVRDAYTRLQEQSDQLRESRLRIVQVADAARRSLERDLHDGVQQRLLAMSVTMERIRRAIEGGRAGEAERLVAELAIENREVLSEMRELARGIYPPLLTERGLVAAVQSASRRSVVPVTLRVEEFDRPTLDVETAAYFCILEGLTNAAKHSGCSGVVVELRSDGAVEFVVSDDGRGFDPATVATSGLLGMEARVAAAGGVLTLDTAPGEGTTLRGRFPMAAAPRRRSAHVGVH